ncbi:serine/threonine protein kinase [Candidatus Uhrbacteria bacterium]|nr:serine/threonine protein kinase [Candidatus Uhrbacteria bacterium]
MGRNDGLVGRGPRFREPGVGMTLEPGPYRILKQIGEGGFGTVFLAVDLRAREQVAVKHLHVRDVPGIKERFEREANVMRLVTHPGVIGFRDYFFDPSYGHFLVMEYVDGRRLDEAIDDLSDTEGTRLEIPFVLHVMERLLETVGFIHGKGIVHRDLKAENVLLLERKGALPDVKLGDFGIAKVLGAAAGPGMHPRLTSRMLDMRKCCIFGSPDYMSPEQIKGAEVGITPSADIYALGALLHLMLIGDLPFRPDPGVENEVINLLGKHLHETPPDPRGLRPDTPEPLAVAVSTAMAKRTEDRFRDAEAFLEAVRAVKASYAAGETVPSESGLRERPRAHIDGRVVRASRQADALARTLPYAEHVFSDADERPQMRKTLRKRRP